MNYGRAAAQCEASPRLGSNPPPEITRDTLSTVQLETGKHLHSIQEKLWEIQNRISPMPSGVAVDKPTAPIAGNLQQAMENRSLAILLNEMAEEILRSL